MYIGAYLCQVLFHINGDYIRLIINNFHAHSFVYVTLVYLQPGERTVICAAAVV